MQRREFLAAALSGATGSLLARPSLAVAIDPAVEVLKTGRLGLIEFVRAYLHSPIAGGTVPPSDQDSWRRYWLTQVCAASGQWEPRCVRATASSHILRQTDTHLATFEFAGFDLEWEHRSFMASPHYRPETGVYFYGSRGVFHMRPLESSLGRLS